MVNKIGKDFETLAQRIIYSYAATFPAFVPVKSECANELSQKEFHSFMESVHTKLYKNPDLLNLTTHPDDCYSTWQLQKHKPELIESMRKCKKKIDEFYLLLFRIGEFGEIKDNKLYVKKIDMKITNKTLSKIESFGLNSKAAEDEVAFWSGEYENIAAAWKLLVKTALDSSLDSMLLFTHSMFNIQHSYSIDIFKKLVENKSAFQELEDFFKQNGYSYIENRENGITVDWVKCYSKKDEPLKGSWAERVHGGISIYYDYTKKNQIIFGLRVPRFKELLMHFNEMDDDLKELIISKTKKCNGCGYCTQTDKTGTRKLQITTVNYNGEHNLCQLFPGFNYIWNSIDNKIASDIIKLLSFIDKVFKDKI